MRQWLLVSLFVCASAQAQYKCVAPDGALRYQDRPCPASDRESTLKAPPAPARKALAKPGVDRVDVSPNPAADGPPEAAPMLGIYRRWIDAERLAGSTSRIALAGPVEVLLSLARETDALSVPACLQRGHEALRRLTQQSAETYVQFMRRNEVASMIYEWVSRPDSIVGFEYELRLASCKRVQ